MSTWRASNCPPNQRHRELVGGGDHSTFTCAGTSWKWGNEPGLTTFFRMTRLESGFPAPTPSLSCSLRCARNRTFVGRTGHQGGELRRIEEQQIHRQRPTSTEEPSGYTPSTGRIRRVSRPLRIWQEEARERTSQYRSTARIGEKEGFWNKAFFAHSLARADVQRGCPPCSYAIQAFSLPAASRPRPPALEIPRGGLTRSSNLAGSSPRKADCRCTSGSGGVVHIAAVYRPASGRPAAAGFLRAT